MSWLFGFLSGLVLPKSSNEDLKRREFILSVLLVATIFLLSSALFLHISVLIFNLRDTETYSNNVLSLIALFIVLLFSISLYALSRKGFFSIASYLLLGMLFLLASYMEYRWGVDVNAGLLLFAVIIVMSGILIDTRFAFVMTGIIAVTIVMVDFLQRKGAIAVNHYWRNEPWTQTDTTMTIIIFLAIATVSWLSNREIEKSLARARRSEAELKVERDSLEITVEERTKELKETQAEKMAQLYRFAEFGRISSGLFHDLVNPLNAVSLNIERIQEGHTNGNATSETKIYVDQAVRAAKKMGDFVSSVRKQLAREESKERFSLNEEVACVIDVLSHKAHKAGVAIRFSAQHEVEMFGDAVKFNQVALNLITNAIDTYAPTNAYTRKGGRTVDVSLRKNIDATILSVSDRGAGIPLEFREKIFEPFFTTKEDMGIGIGLSMTKRIIEKDFCGTVAVQSEEGSGTVFTVYLPDAHAGQSVYRTSTRVSRAARQW